MSRFSTNTNAHHLYEILLSVRESGKQNLRSGWAVALGAPSASPEFSRAHVETMSLLNATMADVLSLTSQQQERIKRYYVAWWSAVTSPDYTWHSDRNCENIISVQDLDSLASTADLIAGSLAGTSSAPSGGDLAQLRNKCEEWLALLHDLPESELPDALKEQLAMQANHLIWLIDNAELFGGARVAQEADGFIGSLTQAIAGMSTNSQTRGKCASLVMTLVGVLFVFNQGVEVAQTSINNADSIVREVSQFGENVVGDE